MVTAPDAIVRDDKVTIVDDGVAGLAKEDYDAALRNTKNVMGCRSCNRIRMHQAG